MRFQTKKKEDLEKIGGKAFAAMVSKMRKDFMKRWPSSVEIVTEKPAFYLSDGDMLRTFAVDLSTMEIKGERYSGSGDTVLYHVGEQLGEGGVPGLPENGALAFVNTYASAQNHPWTLTVVTKAPEKFKQLEVR